jgi:glycosyltransferase involved in cell wall biosynthesis
MRVLLTHEAFAPDFAGGGESILLESARHLIQRGVDVTVLTTGDPRVDSFEGIRTVRLPIGKFRMNLAVPEIAKLARDADLIHTGTFHAAVPSLLAGKLVGKPVVCLVLGLFQEAWHQMHPGLGATFRIAWERLIMRRSFDRLIFLSEYSREDGIRLGAKPAATIANCPGIYPDRYDASQPKDVAVLFAGKLDARKGIHQFLQVARELPDIPFRAMGWGPSAEALRQDAPANVEFLGFLSGRALADTYSRALVCLLPSKAETFGLTLVEAMASGCAVVSSIPLPFEGVRTSPEDTDRMVEAVRHLISHPDKARAMGQGNRVLAQQYTWDRHVDCLLEVYGEALKNHAVEASRVAPAKTTEGRI